MPVITDIDVLREVERGRVPAATTRRAKLVALRAQALAMARDERLADGRASWRIVSLECAPGQAGTLCMDGQRLDAPWLIPVTGRLTAVACAVATIGDALEQRIGALFDERRASLAEALDALGNELLFALSRHVQDRMLADARKQGLTMAGELRAGDPGLGLQAQQTVLTLAGACEIGISLTRTLMMNPTKSTSIVQGVGHELPAATWSRCEQCRSRSRCAVARGAM